MVYFFFVLVLLSRKKTKKEAVVLGGCCVGRSRRSRVEWIAPAFLFVDANFCLTVDADKTKATVNTISGVIRLSLTARAACRKLDRSPFLSDAPEIWNASEKSSHQAGFQAAQHRFRLPAALC